MFLLAVLTLTAILLIAFTVVILSIGGAAFIILFGDIIVCVFIIAMIVKRLRKRRK